MATRKRPGGTAVDGYAQDPTLNQPEIGYPEQTGGQNNTGGVYNPPGIAAGEPTTGYNTGGGAGAGTQPGPYTPVIASGGYGQLAGWDTNRLNNPQDNDPKTVFGRFIQNWLAQGNQWNRAGLDAFLQSDPRWEIQDNGGEPLLRVKQAELDKWKPGTSVWQDVFGDYGGANTPRFENAGGGSPAPLQMPNPYTLPKFSSGNSTTFSGGSSSISPDVDPFASIGGGVFVNGGWVPKGHPGASGGGQPTGGVADPGGTPTGKSGGLWDTLNKLLGEGAGSLNNDILTKRVGAAREDMNRARNSQTEQYQAQLASRGLVGSGSEAGAAKRLEEQLASIYGSQENQIYANEAENADQRLMQALQTAAGLTSDEAQQAIDRYRVDVDRELGLGNINLNRELGLGRLDLDKTLGLGNLALGNAQLGNNWNQFLANYGLDRERLGLDASNSNWKQVSDILQWLLQGAGQSAGGYV